MSVPNPTFPTPKELREMEDENLKVRREKQFLNTIEILKCKIEDVAKLGHVCHTFDVSNLDPKCVARIEKFLIDNKYNAVSYFEDDLSLSFYKIITFAKVGKKHLLKISWGN